jgi:hypothetical protein
MVDVKLRNKAFVNFAAACLGQVSRNVRRIDFAMDSPEAYRVRVVLREESPDDRDALAEILEDFEATREPPYDERFDIALEVLIEAGQFSRPSVDAGYLGLYCEKAGL